MEDLRHTGSSIMGFTILNAKNYREAKASGELTQVRTLPLNEVPLKTAKMGLSKKPLLARFDRFLHEKSLKGFLIGYFFGAKIQIGT